MADMVKLGMDASQYNEEIEKVIEKHAELLNSAKATVVGMSTTFDNEGRAIAGSAKAITDALDKINIKWVDLGEDGKQFTSTLSQVAAKTDQATDSIRKYAIQLAKIGSGSAVNIPIPKATDL